MTSELLAALDPSRVPAFVFVTARIGGLMMTAPLWSMSAMPKSLRAAVTVVLAIALLPATPAVKLPDEPMLMLLPLAMEGLVGIAIGLTAAVLVQALALAGEVISLQMGLNLGPALAPTPDVQVSGLAQLQTIFGLLVYTAMGGHLVLLSALADSLRVLPPGSGFGLANGGAPLTSLFGEMFSCAVRAGAPVMAALLLANVALAVMSRAVPQLNAMMVAFPITIGIGLAVTGIALPIMGHVLGGWFEALPAATHAAIGAFHPGS